MAGADLIGTAICIGLLVIVAYVVAGSIMTTTGIVIDAQNDMTRSQQERLGTSITVANYHYDRYESTRYGIDFRVLNNGNQVIRNIDKMDVVLYHGSNTPKLYINGSGTLGEYTWKWIKFESSRDINEIINPNQWDPGEYLYGKIEVDYEPSNDLLDIILANGVKASTTTAIYRDS